MLPVEGRILNGYDWLAERGAEGSGKERACFGRGGQQDTPSHSQRILLLHITSINRRFGPRPREARLSNSLGTRAVVDQSASSKIDLSTSYFTNPTIELPSSTTEAEHWAVIGPSSAGKTTFFEILRGHHLCFPPTARSYPYLSSPEIERKDHRLRAPSRAIQYVGFAGKHCGGLRGGDTAGAYLSARYESRKEDTDFSVHC